MHFFMQNFIKKVHKEVHIYAFLHKKVHKKVHIYAFLHKKSITLHGSYMVEQDHQLVQ